MDPRTIEPDLSPYTSEQIHFAAGAWPLRAAEELRSALVFRALARSPATPAAWRARFTEALHDELRHARLCATLGARLGAAAPAYDAQRFRERLRLLPEPMMRAAALLLVEVAMGETISVALFRAGRRAAREPLTRATLTVIAGDEARHQALGWEAVTELAADRDRAELRREAARGLAAFERQNAVPALRWLERGEPFEPAYAALGVLAPEARVEAFYFAVERLVVPRLDALGIDGARAWAERYRGDAAVAT